ncbi:hypothetical protein Tco_0386831 [Tanacetum coccineum]
MYYSFIVKEDLERNSKSVVVYEFCFSAEGTHFVLTGPWGSEDCHNLDSFIVLEDNDWRPEETYFKQTSLVRCGAIRSGNCSCNKDGKDVVMQVYACGCNCSQPKIDNGSLEAEKHRLSKRSFFSTRSTGVADYVPIPNLIVVRSRVALAFGSSSDFVADASYTESSFQPISLKPMGRANQNGIFLYGSTEEEAAAKKQKLLKPLQCLQQRQNYCGVITAMLCYAKRIGMDSLDFQLTEVLTKTETAL